MLPAPLTFKRVVFQATAFSLWLATVVAGLVEVYLMRQALVRVSYRMGASVSLGVLIGDVVVLILALAWLVFAFATSEFHRRQAGTPRSWRVFAWTVVVEGVLLGLYLIA